MTKIGPTPIWYNKGMLTTHRQGFFKVILKLGSQLELKSPIFAQYDYTLKWTFWNLFDLKWCAKLQNLNTKIQQYEALSCIWGSNVAFMSTVRFFQKFNQNNLILMWYNNNLWNLKELVRLATDKQRFWALCPNRCKNAPFWRKWILSWTIWYHYSVSSTISWQHAKFENTFLSGSWERLTDVRSYA